MEKLRIWYANLPIKDFAERQSALILQAVLLTFSLLLGFAILQSALRGNWTTAARNIIMMAFMVAVFLFLRRGYFKTAVMLFLGVLLFMILNGMIRDGLRDGLSAMQLTVPIAVVSVLMPRRWIIVTAGVSLAAIVYTALRPQPPIDPMSEFGTIMNYGSVVVLLVIFLTAIGRAYRYSIVEMQKAGAEIEKRNAELERFVYTVSHDLKTPLVTIRGFLGYLQKDIQSGDQSRIQLDITRIVDASEKMQALLNDLLELSRIGRVVNPPQPVSFAEIVQDALQLLDQQIKSTQAQVSVQPDLPIVHVDRVRLVEVMQNLVDNAVKFCNKGDPPRVEIGAKISESGGHVFFVRDNGIGIKSEYHKRVFGLFDKLDPYIEGTGIGLALVKRIIEVHGGEIWVESDGNKGCAFLFTLNAVN